MLLFSTRVLIRFGNGKTEPNRNRKKRTEKTETEKIRNFVAFGKGPSIYYVIGKDFTLTSENYHYSNTVIIIRKQMVLFIVLAIALAVLSSTVSYPNIEEKAALDPPDRMNNVTPTTEASTDESLFEFTRKESKQEQLDQRSSETVAESAPNVSFLLPASVLGTPILLCCGSIAMHGLDQTNSIAVAFIIILWIFLSIGSSK